MENINTLAPSGEDFRWYLKVLNMLVYTTMLTRQLIHRYVVQTVENSQTSGSTSHCR